jgi:hypothetical protein
MSTTLCALWSSASAHSDWRVNYIRTRAHRPDRRPGGRDPQPERARTRVDCPVTRRGVDGTSGHKVGASRWLVNGPLMAPLKHRTATDLDVSTGRLSHVQGQSHARFVVGEVPVMLLRDSTASSSAPWGGSTGHLSHGDASGSSRRCILRPCSCRRFRSSSFPQLPPTSSHVPL